MRTGRHDIVVATRRRRGRALQAERLADEEFGLVTAPAWAERLKGHELPTALESLPVIAYAEDLPIARRHWRHVFDRRLYVQAAITVPDLRGVLTAVTNGAGWSVLPSYLCQGELASGALRPVHQPEDPPVITAYLVQCLGSSTNPHLTLVLEHLLSAAKTW
ncbi:substrate-binding domain-containing protein [Streptomyces sp. NPDC052101]|uniref:substrate-binding domain-containing protein n=1 Tax=Streptomyces sp. NPDC052101 TaxID=3155763 RepID=UPI00343BF4ED